MDEREQQHANRRIGQAIADRRRQLRLSVTDAARNAAIDRGTWSAAEAGKTPLATAKRRAVEGALGWTYGAIELIEDGHEPTLSERGPVVFAPHHGVRPQMSPTAAARLALRQEAQRIAALPIPAEDRLTLVLALIDRLDVGAVRVRPAAAGE